ncbi:MAG: hypothetical protein M1817_001606 [Caeruleum heppii]|nr:MAG: hypothetical protein M1817_001606 [Caeruleum heppii]
MDHLTTLVGRQNAHGSMNPPPGVVPNFDNPVSKAPRLLAANIVCITLGTVFLIGRLLSRKLISRSLGWDDYTAVLSYFFTVVFSACTLVLCKYGLGIHQYELPLTTFAPWFLLWNVITQAFYPWAITFVKVSILLLYLRIFSGTKRKVRWMIHATIWFVVAYNFAGFWVVVFSCRPVEKAYDLTIKGGSCVNRNGLAIAGTVLNIFTDLVMVVIPMPLVWALQLPIRQKIGVSLIFLTAFLGCIMSILRLTSTIPILGNFDLTWYQLEPFMWTVIELWVGICAGCMPAMRPLFKYLPELPSTGLSSLMSSRFTRSRRSQGHPHESTKHSKASKFSNTSVDSNDPRLVEGSYLELGNTTGGRGNNTHIVAMPEKAAAVYGAPNGSHKEMEARPARDLETGLGPGIVKTVGVDIDRPLGRDGATERMY